MKNATAGENTTKPDILAYHDTGTVELIAITETGMRALGQVNPQTLTEYAACNLIREAKLAHGATVEHLTSPQSKRL